MITWKPRGWGVMISSDAEPSGWRSCWRELLYVAVLAFGVHAVVQQQVQDPLCGSLAAAYQRISKGGACSLLEGCPGTPTWAEKVFCATLWHRAEGPITPGHDGYATAVSRATGAVLVGVGTQAGHPCTVCHPSAASVCLCSDTLRGHRNHCVLPHLKQQCSVTFPHSTKLPTAV
jgi:hypothetical protein